MEKVNDKYSDYTQFWSPNFVSYLKTVQIINKLSTWTIKEILFILKIPKSVHLVFPVNDKIHQSSSFYYFLFRRHQVALPLIFFHLVIKVTYL